LGKTPCDGGAPRGWGVPTIQRQVVKHEKKKKKSLEKEKKRFTGGQSVGEGPALANQLGCVSNGGAKKGK